MESQKPERTFIVLQTSLKATLYCQFVVIIRVRFGVDLYPLSLPADSPVELIPNGDLSASVLCRGAIARFGVDETLEPIR